MLYLIFRAANDPGYVSAALQFFQDAAITAEVLRVFPAFLARQASFQT